MQEAAIIYTFMECCKLAQADVRKWLNYSSTADMKQIYFTRN